VWIRSGFVFEKTTFLGAPLIEAQVMLPRTVLNEMVNLCLCHVPPSSHVPGLWTALIPPRT
jgi:hypothetical protein